MTTKTGLVGTALVLPFFLYGHIYNIFQIDKNLIFGKHTFLFPLVLGVSAIGIFLGNKAYRKHKLSINLFVNLFSILLFFMVIFQTIVDLSALKKTDYNNPAFSNEGINVLPSRSTEIGDVYYIVVDGYPRHDLLLEEFFVDNSVFISQLKELGFIVPDCTLGNYDNTIFSLTSSLNMEYLDNLGVIPNEPAKNFKPIVFMIRFTIAW